MIMQILRFLIPHFVTRCLLKDQWGRTQAICHGGTLGDYLIIEPEFVEIANESPTIEVVLGLSWFGHAIFFWLKDSYDKIET